MCPTRSTAGGSADFIRKVYPLLVRPSRGDVRQPSFTMGRFFDRSAVEHVKTKHADAVAPAYTLLPSLYSLTERVAAVYNEALAIRSREAAPIASYAIDRKCLRKGAEAIAGDNIQSLICFLCACVHPYRRQDEDNFPLVSWAQPCSNPSFFCPTIAAMQNTASAWSLIWRNMAKTH